jgi:hypothetical protein
MSIQHPNQCPVYDFLSLLHLFERQSYTAERFDGTIRSITEWREDLRRGFYRTLEFTLTQSYVVVIPGIKFDVGRMNYYNKRLGDKAFAQIEPWLQEHCPSFKRLGPLIGIQDDDEAFSFRMKFG